MAAKYQASYRPFLSLRIKVFRGRNITLGSFNDFMDTPDPYVKLFISSSPDRKKKTTVKKNNANPIWNEEFKFLLNPDMENNLDITLVDHDTLKNDIVGRQTLNLNGLEIDRVYQKTLVFGKSSEVDMEIKVEECAPRTDMRHSKHLCEEENEFRQKRKQVVLHAMRKLLGTRGPQTLDEVPSIAVLGSGGGFRAMVSLSGVLCALKDMSVLDCTMYTAGLSGSAWYLSTLYSHPGWPNVHPNEIREQLRENIKESWMSLLTPSWLYKHVKVIRKKKSAGQPVSFTDFFGYLVGETILKDRKNIPKLSDQRLVVQGGKVPFPLYTCVQVKNDVSALKFSEWMEFNPYEIGMLTYGTFMKTEHFGSKFFCGQLMTPVYPEPSLTYLQGIWGSAFTILLQRILREGESIENAISSMHNSDDLNEELQEAEPVQDDDDSDEEDDETDAVDGQQTEMEPEDNDDKFMTGIMESFIKRCSVLKTRRGRAGLVHNFLRGLQLMSEPSEDVQDVTDAADHQALRDKHICLVDSGLAFNSPYPLLLRPERDVDIFLSFDFSARDKDDEMPFQELLMAEKWARKNNLKFPPINAKEQYQKDGLKEYYVFAHPTDPTCPVVVHFVLVNKTFKEESYPGVPRSTDEEKKFADFSVFEDPKGHYSTFNFKYPPKQFDRLSELNKFNTLLAEKTIIDVMADCVRKRRARNANDFDSNDKNNNSSKSDGCKNCCILL